VGPTVPAPRPSGTSERFGPVGSRTDDGGSARPAAPARSVVRRAGASMALRHDELAPLLATLVILVGVVVADVVTGEQTVVTSLMITAPLLSAAFIRPAITGVVGGAATALAITLSPGDLMSSSTDVIRVLSIFAGSALAVFIAARRERRERDLVAMTIVADTAQNAVLWPVPAAVGDLCLTARYVSASAAAKIGGDLYEVADTEHGVRLIIGDVRGKGLPAVRMTSAVLGCFREVAHTREDLVGLHEALEATVRRVAGPEDFVTATLVELRPDGSGAVLSAGHPAPLLVTGGQVTPLPLAATELPLGLGTGSGDVAVERFRFDSGTRMLLHTDGLLEARDEQGRFFPASHQLEQLCDGSADACLDELLERLSAFCGGHISDDVALLLVERSSAVPAPRD
jgi:sigma-B regulation protein RsbU (phosphoserine phosphatase)